MVKLLSYCGEREGRYVEETLEEHVKAMLGLLERFEGSWAQRVGDGLLERLGCRELRFRDLLVTAAVYHDVGKAFYAPRNRKCSYPGHEVLSAFIVEKTRDNLPPPTGGYDPLAAVGFAVLYHHHSMSLKSRKLRLIIEKPGAAVERLLGFFDSMEGLVAPRELLEETRAVLESVKDMSAESLIVEAKGVVERAEREFWKIEAGSKAPEGKRLQKLLLALLVALDDVAAEEVRGRSNWLFADVCRELLLTAGVDPSVRIDLR